MKNVKCYLTTIFILLAIKTGVFGQVTIAPTNLFINDQNRFGTFLVVNGSGSPQEVSISFEFSYPQTDENGIRKIVKDSSLNAPNSIQEYVRAFPQQFVIQPGQRQIIRLRVNAPNSLQDGTYWTRIKTASSTVSDPIEIQNQSTVAAQVGIKVEQITGLFYKAGDVNTEININDIKTQKSIRDGTEYLEVFTSFERLGNSPFLGTIRTEILDLNGKIVSETTTSTSYYFDGTHSSQLDISGMNDGNYQIRISFDNSRSDISESDRIPMTPVSKTIPITL